jgi:hypothetical protein
MGIERIDRQIAAPMHLQPEGRLTAHGFQREGTAEGHVDLETLAGNERLLPSMVTFTCPPQTISPVRLSGYLTVSVWPPGAIWCQSASRSPPRTIAWVQLACPYGRPESRSDARWGGWARHRPCRACAWVTSHTPAAAARDAAPPHHPPPGWTRQERAPAAPKLRLQETLPITG